MELCCSKVPLYMKYKMLYELGLLEKYKDLIKKKNDSQIDLILFII